MEGGSAWREDLPGWGFGMQRGICRGGQKPLEGGPPTIQSTGGRYASYWNAFLFQVCDPFTGPMILH